MSDSTPNGRDLLFALLALQNNFVGRNALLTAFTRWTVGHSPDLAVILAEDAKLQPHQVQLLHSLTDEHLRGMVARRKIAWRRSALGLPSQARFPRKMATRRRVWQRG